MKRLKRMKRMKRLAFMLLIALALMLLGTVAFAEDEVSIVSGSEIYEASAGAEGESNAAPAAPEGEFYEDPAAAAARIPKVEGDVPMASVYGTGVDSPIKLYVNGMPVGWSEVEPFIDGNSRTLVPLRPVAVALGLSVDWNQEEKKAIFSGKRKGEAEMVFPIGSRTAYTSEVISEDQPAMTGEIGMDTEAIIVNGRTLAPVRYLAEYFGYSVGWDSTTRSVIIESDTELMSSWQ